VGRPESSARDASEIRVRAFASALGTVCESGKGSGIKSAEEDDGVKCATENPAVSPNPMPRAGAENLHVKWQAGTNTVPGYRSGY
jgi:hypothetical protein